MFDGGKERPWNSASSGSWRFGTERRRFELRGSRERELLAYLLLHANELVPCDRLIDELWGPSPLATVSTVLQVYVSRLRKLLGDNGTALITRRPGYVLELDPEQIDLRRFERLLAAGRRIGAEGDAAGAVERLDEALSLWRGAALADFSSADWAQPEIDRLEGLRLAAIEERIEAELTLGRHAALVPELEALVALHPLRERLSQQLIVALYRCGRQAEALRVYADTRRALAEEVGLEPSAALRQLEQDVLMQDPALELQGPERRDVPARPRRRRFRLRTLLAGGIALLLVAAGGAVVAAHGTGTATVRVVPESVAVIDARTNKVVTDIPLRARTGGIAAGFGSVWVTDVDDGTVIRIDSASAQIVRTIGVGASPVAVAAAGGRLWVGNPSRLVGIDPGYDHTFTTTRLVQKIPGFGPKDVGYDTTAAIASGPAGLWVAHTVSALSKIEPRTGAVVRGTTLDDPPSSLAVGEDTIWVVLPASDRLLAVDPSGASQPSSIRVPAMTMFDSPSGTLLGAVALGFGSIWVPTKRGISRIDPLTGGTLATIPAGAAPAGIAVGEHSVWVTDYFGGTVSRIDPTRNTVVSTVHTGHNPMAVVTANGRVWVTIA